MPVTRWGTIHDATRAPVSTQSTTFAEGDFTRSPATVQVPARSLEILENRELLATFTVTNLHSAGAGSLRQAIINSNAQPGANTIDFGVAGTIRLTRSALPAITDTVTIDGATAPTFAGSPVVTVDFNGKKGLQFAAGSDGSTLKSLSLVKASSAGVTLSASRITVQANYIGLRANGKTVAANHGDGIRINASSQNDLIGQTDPVSSINYYPTTTVYTSSGTSMPVSGWQGIRAGDAAGQYLITGTSDDNGLLYEGPITASGGTAYAVNFPDAATTSVYGPDNLGGGSLRLVGSYTKDARTHGFVFNGTTAQLDQTSAYQAIDYPRAQFTYAHSTMGNLIVGNADGPEANLLPDTGHAFMYSEATNSFLPDIAFPGAVSTTAYGIWYNGGTSYTICGGYSSVVNPSTTVGNGYLVDYDSATGAYSHWTPFAYQNGQQGQDYVTHFQGISSTESGVYTLSADSIRSGSTTPEQGSWVTVRRNTDGSFGPAVWVSLGDAAALPSPSVTSNDAVYGNQVVGFDASGSNMVPYQGTINTSFQLSNVISGNTGNGIGIHGADGNVIAMNNIGTDLSGTRRRGNARNGIFVTQGAEHNIIGGQATGGNDPTGQVYVRPPQGNLISGNSGDGVLIKNGSTQNLLSGNFVGTAASGDSALGNRQDGVAVVKADSNQLIGCTFQQNPFVFYNVLGGNGGNGLRITSSNDTTVQANFMGAAADNSQIVANKGDGLLISGHSQDTQVGGVIPLGNVISGNNHNGIEVSDSASGVTSFNTFAGIYAFGGAAPNKGDGILVTSNGGNNLIRTCIVSGNLRNGIELGGHATGVQVTETSIGTNTNIQSGIANGGDGILITGHAHDNAIGGFQPSIEPQVTISDNRGYAIDFTGSAHDNAVFHTTMGANASGQNPLGNRKGGIDMGQGTSSNKIGGTALAFQNIIRFNGGSGVTIKSSPKNVFIGNSIQYNARDGIKLSAARSNTIGTGTTANAITGNARNGIYLTGNAAGTMVQGNLLTSNAKNGVTLSSARKVTIGGSNTLAAGNASTSGNGIVSNLGYGLYASGTCSGTLVQQNIIVRNSLGNVDLSKSRGVTYIPVVASTSAAV